MRSLGNVSQRGPAGSIILLLCTWHALKGRGGGRGGGSRHLRDWEAISVVALFVNIRSGTNSELETAEVCCWASIGCSCARWRLSSFKWSVLFQCVRLRCIADVKKMRASDYFPVVTQRTAAKIPSG